MVYILIKYMIVNLSKKIFNEYFYLINFSFLFIVIFCFFTEKLIIQSNYQVIGKPYYERFGYIYHPDYKCVYCDNEFMEMSRILKKSIYIDKLIIKHDHVTVHDSINYGKVDETHRSGSCKESRDQLVFQRRRNLLFPQIKITDD